MILCLKYYYASNNYLAQLFEIGSLDFNYFVWKYSGVQSNEDWQSSISNKSFDDEEVSVTSKAKVS